MRRHEQESESRVARWPRHPPRPERALTKHFIKDGGLKPFIEAPSRLPDLTSEERAAYLADIEARTPEFLPVFHLLMNTGADLGEVFSRRVRDVSFGDRLARIDYRRTKTDRV